MELSVREKIWAKALDERGEDLDATPVAVPGDAVFPETIEQMISRMINTRLAETRQAGIEESPSEIDELLNVDREEGVDSIITQHTVLEMEGFEPTVDEYVQMITGKMDVPPDLAAKWDDELDGTKIADSLPEDNSETSEAGPSEASTTRSPP